MGYLDHVAACNRHEPSAFVNWSIAGQRIGYLHLNHIEPVLRFGDVFTIDGDPRDGADLLMVGKTPAERTQAMAELLDQLVGAGVLPRLRGEQYAVKQHWHAPSLMTIDRDAVGFFGIPAFGLHVNGIVPPANGDPREARMWIARRNPTLRIAPGKLDNLVAGGQPAGLTLMQNLIKEAAEEAAIPEPLAATARPVGAVSYTMDVPDGVKRDTMFVYDLILPPDFAPTNTDGEVDTFTLMDLDQVAARVRQTDDFKFNVNLVIIDFLIRHSLLTPDDPDYLDLLTGLHR